MRCNAHLDRSQAENLEHPTTGIPLELCCSSYSAPYNQNGIPTPLAKDQGGFTGCLMEAVRTRKLGSYSQNKEIQSLLVFLCTQHSERT